MENEQFIQTYVRFHHKRKARNNVTTSHH